MLEVNVQEDHVHLVLSIPPKYAVSELKGFLKGKLALRLFDRYPDLCKRYWGQHVWSRGYCVSTVGLDEDRIWDVFHRCAFCPSQLPQNHASPRLGDYVSIGLAGSPASYQRFDGAERMRYDLDWIAELNRKKSVSIPRAAQCVQFGCDNDLVKLL